MRGVAEALQRAIQGLQQTEKHEWDSSRRQSLQYYIRMLELIESRLMRLYPKQELTTPDYTRIEEITQSCRIVLYPVGTTLYFDVYSWNGKWELYGERIKTHLTVNTPISERREVVLGLMNHFQ